MVILKKILTVLLLISITFVENNETSGVKVKIECKEIYEHRWWYLERKYVTCRDWPSSLTANKKGLFLAEVVHPNGTEVELSNNIKALSIVKAKMKFLPRGIKNKFPSLKAIDIASCGLTHLDVDNMKQFGMDLEYASFGQNEITVLRANLFHYNSNLIAINFNANPLKTIEPAFFINLKHMCFVQSVTFWDSGCIDDGFGTKHSHCISTFEWNKNCSSTVSSELNDSETSVPLVRNEECVLYNC